MQKEIYDYINSLTVFSEHDHHFRDEFFQKEMTLDRVLENSYVSWNRYVCDGSYESRKSLIDNTQFNSYFYWFEKGMQKLHGIDAPLNIENWEEISNTIRNAYLSDSDFHWKSLINNGYERMIQDSNWNPGDNNGHDELFSAAFRVDQFMCGYNAEAVGEDSLVPWKLYGFDGGNLNDYVELIRETIKSRHRTGKVVALKCVEAYLRPIDFLPDEYEEAKKVFGLPSDQITPKQKILFGNYIFNRCCELTSELDIPFQVHTGLGKLSGSRPMLMEPIIAKYPLTRFVLLHSGFPWTHEISGLAHNYKNVILSLAWTATISTSVAIRSLHDYIDVAPSINSITWGSDCSIAEESIGALLAWKFIVSKVLEERLEDKRINMTNAKVLARKLMHENGRNVYLKKLGTTV